MFHRILPLSDTLQSARLTHYFKLLGGDFTESRENCGVGLWRKASCGLLLPSSNLRLDSERKHFLISLRPISCAGEEQLSVEPAIHEVTNRCPRCLLREFTVRFPAVLNHEGRIIP